MARYAVVLALLTAACGSEPQLPRVGEPAPDFRLVSDDGTEVALSDHRGQWVVLYFYPKDFSTACTIQARMFQQDIAKYRSRNAVILGVSMDSVESHRSFCSAQGLDYALLSDPDGQVSEAYGSIRGAGNSKFSRRNTFIVDPDGNVIRVYLEVNPGTHSREVLADLARFQGDAPSADRPSVLDRITPRG